MLPVLDSMTYLVRLIDFTIDFRLGLYAYDSTADRLALRGTETVVSYVHSLKSSKTPHQAQVL